LEVVLITVALQLRVGRGAACATCSRTVHADDFAPAIRSTDDPPFVVPRLGGQFRRKPRRQLAPLGRREDVRGIGNVAGTATRHLLHGEGQHIRSRSTHDGLKLGGQKLDVTVEPLQRTRHRHIQEIAVGQDPGHGDGEQNQRHHGHRQSRGQLHGAALPKSNTA
jgi:hypothetical protein